MSKSKHRVFKRPNVGFCKQADFCGTSILNCLLLVCMLFCIKGNKKPVKCDRLVKSWKFFCPVISTERAPVLGFIAIVLYESVPQKCTSKQQSATMGLNVCMGSIATIQ